MTLELFPESRPGERGRRAPLADRMRPRHLDEVVGQSHLIGGERPLRRRIESGELGSMILWGPPGSGKTTIARLIASRAGLHFVAYSAVTSGVRDIRNVIAGADARWRRDTRPTVLFIDEIHRFNRAQQDAFLPHVESGLLVLIGATTENPSFEVNAALLSRVQVYVLHPLEAEDVACIVRRALADSERGLGRVDVAVEPAAVEALTALAGGDARVALNVLEGTVGAALQSGAVVTRSLVEEVAGRPAIRHDRRGDSHYDLISALIKSVRGSDADGAMYWLARLVEGGEDPLFIARRLVILAAEDVGNAEPRGLLVAQAAYQATHAIGMPEAGLILAQATTFLATAPKSNAALEALVEARRDARRTGTAPVPLDLRNAPTRLLQELGHGRDYRYAHDEDDRGQQYLPPELRGRRYYRPRPSGYERELAVRIRERDRERAGAQRPTRRGDARSGQDGGPPREDGSGRRRGKRGAELNEPGAGPGRRDAERESPPPR